MTLKWRNVPMPEPYLVAMGGGLALELLEPHAITTASTAARVVGAVGVLAGIGLAVWSVATADEVLVDTPTALVVSGPYRRSRNPMYLAWTWLAGGVALIVNSAWLLGFAPLAFLFLHLVVIPREEARLRAAFGDEYSSYKSRVRRYL